jgi:UPF0042 nucleotide-binding protein
MSRISLISFGQRYGQPDADIMFSAILLPDPYFYLNVKGRTGLEKEVSDIVLREEETQDFILNALIHIMEEVKYTPKLTVAVGCAGGKHRSVAITRELLNLLEGEGQRVILFHRDINKND